MSDALKSDHSSDNNAQTDSHVTNEGAVQSADRKLITAPLRLDAQEFCGFIEDELVDFETAEEFLLHFSRIGQVMFVKKLITLRDTNEVPLNINCKGESKSNYGWSPLHLAAYFGHADVVEVLLENGADVDIQNEEGDTPLHKAAYTGREQIVVQLLASQANVFLINGDGLRPYELTQSASIRQLLAAAEKSDIRRREDKFLSSARTGDVAMLKQLLEDTTSPVNINCVDTSGNTALHCAAYRGQNEAVIFLLKNGIDTTTKNNRGQMASNLATTISLKQLIQEVHLSVMTPKAISSLKNRSVSRYEGLLFRKGRFFGWKLNWAVLERGVFSFFANRADATTGARRKGYKYLEGAMTEVLPQTDNPLTFIIIFGDRSRAMFCLPKSQSELDLQKWISAINDHIYFGTNFIKQGTFIDDSDDEDEAAKLLSSPSVQDMILTANAHQKILEKHIGALQQLLDDESLFASGNFEDSINDDSTTAVHGSQASLPSSTVLSIKFHLNLILESSRNSNSSLTQCLTLISRQNEARQHQIRQEQEKVRVLEEALQLLAREHHDLERSVLTNSMSMSTTGNNTVADSLLLSTGQSRSRPTVDRVRSIGCLSQSTTDIDEFYDAFDDIDDEDGEFLEDLSDKTAVPDQIDNKARLCSDPSKMNEFFSLEKTSRGEFLTAQDATINDSLSTLSPDDDENKTLASDDIPYSRERLPAPMVPRDEVGLWSILKHCIGKELSKITFPVVFNEPLSFLQRMTEIFQYSEYLNIADQCENIVERMENVCTFIVSAYSSNWLRLNKPFNPLLGETFEYEIESSETRVVFEQVSHHPPISAWHAESPHYVLRGTICPKLRFWGKSIEVKPEGSITLELKSKGEVYTWKSVNCCVHNIIVGKLWFEQYGTIEVHNRTNNYKINLNFKPAGWFGHDLNRFEGFILNANKEKVRFLYGKWNDYLKSATVEDYDEYMKVNNNKFRAPDKPSDDLTHSTPRKLISKFTKQLTGGSIDLTNNNNDAIETSIPKNLPPEEPNGDIPKSDSSHSLDISNSRILWKAQPRPEHSSQYYHFNHFTFGLNELPSDSEFLGRLPTTDSRFRPDIRKLEEGDLDAAASEKNRLEEKQREARRLRKKRKEKEHEPLWFRMEVNRHTNEDDWQFNSNYWQRDWSRCPDIF